MTVDGVWLVVGLLGQGLFFMRFLVQWIASERLGTSILPRAFWYFSILGGVTLFAYAVHRGDLVFTIGQGMGLFIYARNIVLGRRPARETAAAPRAA